MAGRRLIALSGLVAGLLAACAAPLPFVADGARQDIPAQVAAEHDVGDVTVLWGGMIVALRERGEGSEIEVLAQPLDARQQPITDAPTLGRFAIRVTQRLTRVDAPEGRYLTVRGHVAGSAQGFIGPTPYRYPILDDAHWLLWPSGFQFEGRRWSVGVGASR